jgi:ATP-dependent DNA helicase RecG
VIGEIGADLAAPVPMHRLLQGEVGSGKTVVAVTALLAAVEGGHQGALMAPTEVLAEQHHQSVTALLEGFSLPDDGNLFGARQLSVALLTNRTTAPSAGRSRPAWRRGRSTSSSAPTRCSRTRSPSPPSVWR